jgi:hypothetical protein
LALVCTFDGLLDYGEASEQRWLVDEAHCFTGGAAALDPTVNGFECGANDRAGSARSKLGSRCRDDSNAPASCINV